MVVGLAYRPGSEALLRQIMGHIVCRGCFAVVAMACACPSFGANAVLKLRDFTLSAPRDPGIRFATAVTPNGALLAMIANESGNWQFYRVRNWLNEQPSEDRLALEGFFSKKDGADMHSLYAQVLVTRDGRYAVCLASASWWKTQGGRAVKGTERSDDAISVVDLANLNVVAATHTRKMGLEAFQGDVKLDHDGYVLVDSLSADEPRRGTFLRLSIPTLSAGPKCSYTWIRDSLTKQHREPACEGACREALGASTAFEQYFQVENPPFSWPPEVCKGSTAQFCRWPGEFTADGKYGVAERREGHDDFFGNWVISRLTVVVFSTAKALDIGEVQLPTSGSVQTQLAYLDGRDYLFVVEDGRHVTVYELRD
jgi:hypothetical protein